MTTNLRYRDIGGNVVIPAGQAGLPRDSVVVVSQLATVHRSFLPTAAGVVESHLVRRIVNGIHELIEPAKRG